MLARLGGIDIAHADQHGVLRRNLGRVAQHVRQLLRPHAQQRRQRHSVDVAARRGFGRIDVGVRVDPDDADLLVLAPVELRHARNRARGDGVVSAQHEGRHPLFQGLGHCFRRSRAGLGDLLQITRIRAAEFLRLGDFDGHVAAVLDMMAEGLQPRLQARYAHRRGPHVDAAAAGAHVERHADHANLSRRQGLGSAGWKRSDQGIDFRVCRHARASPDSGPSHDTCRPFPMSRNGTANPVQSGITGVVPIPQKVYRK